MLKSFCKFVYILQLKANFKSRPKIKTFYERSGKMFYTIGEMAKKMGVAPSTLRYYDKEGLLPFVERSGGGGYRVAFYYRVPEKDGYAHKRDKAVY